MKKTLFTLLFIFTLATSCRGKKAQLKKPSVEIKDEFGNQDSLLKYQTAPIITKETKDTLVNKIDDQ